MRNEESMEEEKMKKSTFGPWPNSRVQFYDGARERAQIIRSYACEDYQVMEIEE